MAISIDIRPPYNRQSVRIDQAAAHSQPRDYHLPNCSITKRKWRANSELRKHTTAGAAKLATVESTFCVVRSTILTTIPTVHVADAKVSAPQLIVKSTKIGRKERRVKKTALRRRKMLGIDLGARSKLTEIA
jgi:hypothetical protein